MWHDYALIRLFHYTHLKLQLYHRNVCFYFLLPQKISELFWMTCVESLRLGNDTVTDTVVDWSWNYMQIIPFLAPATRLQRLGTYVKLSQSFRRPQNFQLWSELRKITHESRWNNSLSWHRVEQDLGRNCIGGGGVDDNIDIYLSIVNAGDTYLAVWGGVLNWSRFSITWSRWKTISLIPWHFLFPQP